VIFKRFDVVVVPFPFSDRAATKRRPGLVVSSDRFNADHDHVVLAMITTAADPAWPSDVDIRDLDGAGLKARSVVRLKIFTVDRALVIRKIGALSRADTQAAKAVLDDAFA